MINKTKTIISIFLSILLLISLLPTFPNVSAESLTENGYVYYIIEGEVTIDDYRGNGGNIEIPSTLGGYPVTRIINYPFFGKEKIESITIPDSVESINDFAFYGCFDLINITVNENNPNYSDINGVLFDKNKTTLIIYPDGKPETSYIIPNTTIKIKYSAFYYNLNLRSITVPESVTSIDHYPFGRLFRLANITVNENNPNYSDIDGILFDKNKTTLIIYPDGKPETSYIIPNNTIKIGDDAFYGNGILENIIMPDSVTDIGNYAFSSCNSLKNITIGNNVEFIGTFAFSYCQKLENIIIPNTVEFIGFAAFRGCSNLTSIYFNGFHPGGYAYHAWEYMFEYGSNELILYCPEGDSTWDEIEINGLPGVLQVKRFEASEKQEQNPPAALTFFYKLTTRIVLNFIMGAEYSIDNGVTWQDSNMFENLTPNTEYNFIARFKETSSHKISPASAVFTVKTDAEIIEKQEQNPPAAPTLASRTSAQIILTAIPNAQYRRGNGVWQTSPIFTGLSPNTSYTFQAYFPETETHNASNVSAIFTVSTTKSTRAKPSVPRLRSKTHNSVTLQSVTNAQYRRGNGTWQTSPIFKGLTPNTKYNFQIRIRETATHNASPASNTFTTTTNRQRLATPKSLKLTKKRATWRNVANNNGYTLRILQGKKVIRTAQIRKNITRYNIPKNLLKKKRSYKFTLIAKGTGRFSNSNQINKNINTK